MPDASRNTAKPKHVTQCRDIYEVLDHNIRLRPGMWVHNGSLQELMTILIGYSVALDVHEGGGAKPPTRHSTFWFKLVSILSLLPHNDK